MPTVVKPEIIAEYKTHETDTGSSEVQVALLTARINHLTEHLRTHRKDFHSRRGLLQMASRRRKLLDYLKKHDLPKYSELLQKLNLRKYPLLSHGRPDPRVARCLYRHSNPDRDISACRHGNPATGGKRKSLAPERGDKTGSLEPKNHAAAIPAAAAPLPGVPEPSVLCR